MADTSREDTIRPVTFEIEQVSHAGKTTFQARARLDGIVIQDIGPAESTDLRAFDHITRALARRVRA